MPNLVVSNDVSEKHKFSTETVVDGESVNLSAILVFNSNKGLISIDIKISDSCITGDEIEDKGMIKSFEPVILEAIQKGMELKSNWNAAREDKNQTKLEFGLPSTDQGEPAPATGKGKSKVK